MNLFKFAAATCVLIGSVITLVSSKTIPGASTNIFYLVASTPNDPAANMKPVRIVGGTEGNATLSGNAPIGEFYFFENIFVTVNSTRDAQDTVYIGAVTTPSGCTTYGPLSFTLKDGRDDCSNENSFNIRPDEENKQLGAYLVFNFVGGFYACGSEKDVWYQVDPSDGPPDLQCSPITLYTVPL